MGMSLLREAIAENLDTIPDTQVSAYILANPTPPFIQVFPNGTEYDRTMDRMGLGGRGGGHDDQMFTVQAVVARNSDVGAQRLLDRFQDNAEPYSVKTAIESDKTLGGLCQDLHVQSASGVQIIQTATGGEMLVVEWTVLVLAPGDA